MSDQKTLKPYSYRLRNHPGLIPAFILGLGGIFSGAERSFSLSSMLICWAVATSIPLSIVLWTARSLPYYESEDSDE